MTIPARNPFGDSAKLYRANGFAGTLPLPPRAKETPPAGYTGHGRPMPSDAKVDQWIAENPDGNICLRLGEVDDVDLGGRRLPVVYGGNTVDGWALFGVDVDEYDDKHGARQLTDLEAELGPLPATVMSSARWATRPQSGIRVFLVPKGFRYKSKAAKHIDTVHAGHRYMVAWPSRHPSGSTYEWRGCAGEVPSLAEVAVLPEAWFEHLVVCAGSGADARAGLSMDELDSWAQETFRNCTGEPCGQMARELERYMEVLDESDQHTPLNTVIWRFTMNAVEGHAGWFTAMNAYLAHWFGVSNGKRDVDTMNGEIWRSLTGALDKANAMHAERGGYLPEDTCGVDARNYNVDAWGPGDDVAVEGGSSGSGPGRRKLFSANDLKAAEQPKFLAKNRIPQAAITVLIGEEGIGKSLFWVMLTAAITTGNGLPEIGLPARPPDYVIVVATEDDWSSTVRPRLEVAGADLDYIHVLCEETDGSGAPIFPDDMDLVVEADPPGSLVVCDTWLDTVPGSINVQRPQEARRALHPWKEAATKTGAAMLLLAHSNRMPTANIRDRYGATAALRMKARATLYCLQDSEGRLLVGPDKANGSPARVKATRYRIEAKRHFDPKPDHDGMVPLLVFDGYSNKTIKEHLAEEAAVEKDKTRHVSDCEKWLLAYLSDGPKKAADVYVAGADSEGEFSKDQLKRVKKRVARAFKTDDAWWWELLVEPDAKPANNGCPDVNNAALANFSQRYREAVSADAAR